MMDMNRPSTKPKNTAKIPSIVWDQPFSANRKMRSNTDMGAEHGRLSTPLQDDGISASCSGTENTDGLPSEATGGTIILIADGLAT